MSQLSAEHATDIAAESKVFDPDCHPLFREVPSSVEFKKLRKRLLRETRQAISDYKMVPDGASPEKTKWLICLSGGKDSYTLLAVLMDLKWRGLLPVDLIACNLDQSQPGFPQHILPEFFERYEIPNLIVRENTYGIVTDKLPETSTYCSLCSRLRRGILYRTARELGCEAIVLGHHRDDALETFMMNMFHGGRMASMPPKLVNDEGDLMVLRPLMNSSEVDIEKFSKAMEFPIIPCNLCGSQDGLQRVQVKNMLQQWEKETPGRLGIMARALAHVRPSHLHDAQAFDFVGLRPNTGEKGESDQEPCAAAEAMTEKLFGNEF
ncbi:tRNA 2-thiocytidine biosynthesis protein TtcA [Pseudovibrio denitrificans]|uniref:tRNA-cytidine(32) 2-sulfurtransferase n=1 Tax=Pseudovibrio denitrificans TaxID=258256 RepID=A0A1I6ZPC0_9HYPH|nr:tRNA 2-thiocytidine(32) synthetase TtcA [Pseudovibrio denitrificans]SFT64574.1 tRNA 2-thiocytidine biosynthesis protein TtcA [Pseudovibrio denitrificans]